MARSMSDAQSGLVVAESGTERALAFRSRTAARAIGVSERTLWEWTNKKLVPFIRIGRVVLYPVDQLLAWLRERVEGGSR